MFVRQSLVMMLQSCRGEVAQLSARINSARFLSVPCSREWQGHCARLSANGLTVMWPAAGAAQVSTSQTYGLYGAVLSNTPHWLELGAAEVHPQDQDSRLQR